MAVEVPFANSIKIRFVNKAEMNSEIAHNIAILKEGSTDQVIKDLQAAGYDLGKMKSNPNVLAMTKALDPGGEDVLEFLPPKAGFYPYMCLMAGHGDMLAMKGVLHVK